MANSLRLGQRNNWFRSETSLNKLHRDEWINKLVTGVIKKKIGLNSECVIKERHGKLYVYSLIYKPEHKKRSKIRLNIIKKRSDISKFDRLCSLLRFTKSKSLRTRILLREISVFLEKLIGLITEEEIKVRWIEVSSVKCSSYMIGNWMEKSLNQDEKSINERKVLWALYRNE